MIRTIHALIAAVLILPTHAQLDALPDSNAGWTVSFWIGPGYPYEGYFYAYDTPSPDTLIAGDVFKKLNVTNTFGLTDYAGAVRDNELGQVYFCEPGSSVPALLYDFDVLPGDTLLDVFGLYSHDVRVFALDTITINGTPRRRVEVECLGLSGATGIYWIQGIGSTQGLLQTAVCGSVSGIGELVCMTVNDTVQWGANVGGVGDCELALGLPEASEPALELTVHPVPAEEQLFVRGAMAGARAEVYAPDGRQVMASTTIQGPLQIGGLLSGVHLLRVTEANGNVRTVRFVKR